MENEPRKTAPEEEATPAFPGLSGVRPLGMGGMGSVFSARQDDLGRRVAVKTLRGDLEGTPAWLEQFTREAHVLARLDHPGIVPVHYAGQTDDGPYYVMRLVDGTSVDRHLAGASAVEVAEVFRDIADALEAAHAQGVLHRDVKPANILVEPSGRPVLVDFGLSTSALHEEGAGASEGLVGTPDYLAPEIFEGGAYSPASDVYALGATLYRCLTGCVPFPEQDLSEKLRAIREEDPPPPRQLRPDVPKPLQAVCLKAMERSPVDRYPSARELRNDLDRFLAGEPVEALPVRSRSLLRQKIEKHMADHARWEELGLLEERQRLALQLAFEKIDEEERNLMRGVLTSLPNLLLLAGLILTVFGPALLQLIAWQSLDQLGRIGLPGVPLLLLATIGIRRWRAGDRRRGLACLIGAALLAVPASFGLVDLVPALRAVVDEGGTAHPVLPGPMWFPASDAPAWMHEGFRLLQWKVLGSSLLVLGVVGLLFRGTRSAFFLWLIGLAAAGTAVPAAQLLGWEDVPSWSRWLLEGTGSLVAMAIGLPLDRKWRRDRALPFYGLGFVWAVTTALKYASQGLPLVLLDLGEEFEASAWSLLLHGSAVVAGGLVGHFRGTALLRQAAGAPLVVGFALTYFGLSELAMEGHALWEILLVADCAGFLVLGLALHRNSLVLPTAIALPFTVGSISQRHMDAVWAWSMTIVLLGVALVLLALRLAARSRRDQAPAPSRSPGGQAP